MIADRVAAVVNDQVILVSEVDLRMLPLRHEAAKIADKAERDRRLAKLALQMLEEMINDELIVQAAKDAKITVEQSEIDATIQFLMKEHKLDRPALEKAMKEQGVTLATLRNDLLRQRAINQLVGSKITVTEEDAKARYDELQRRSDSVSRVDVSQLVWPLADPATDAQTSAAKRGADAAIARLRAGEAFVDVASSLAGAVQATDHLWLDAGTVIPELDTIVFAMDKGDIRGPIATPHGVYVVVANELERTKLKPFAEMKEQLAGELRRKALAKHTQAWIAELRKKAYIDIKLQVASG